MGMTEEDGPHPSAGFLEAFRARADAGGAMTFARFVDLALYDPRVGYYRSARERVGRGPGTDFFTAAINSSSVNQGKLSNSTVTSGASET